MVETVIQRTKLLLKEKGLKQKYLFEQIGKSPVLFNDWKNGKSKPTDEVLKNIADVSTPRRNIFSAKPSKKKSPPKMAGWARILCAFWGAMARCLKRS